MTLSLKFPRNRRGPAVCRHAPLCRARVLHPTHVGTWRKEILLLLKWIIALFALCLLPALAAAQVQFVDATRSAGIDFHHRHGGTGEKYPMETMGSGAVFFDYDLDGWIDLYFVNSAGSGALYHNRADGTFTDETQRAGVADGGYGLGCTAADYDSDGDLDLYITAYGPNTLYRNEGDGTFGSATDQAGIAGPQFANPGMSTGAAFADYDSDGDLDLYVGNYAQFRPEIHEPCIRAGNITVYCGPEAFKPQRDVFYRNEGDGTFTDVTDAVGILPAAAKELGSFFIDYDQDFDLDLYVAGDRTPNLLYRNDSGRFAEVGALAGVAYNDMGKPLAGMGVDVGDYDNDGLFDFFVTNYQWETNSLYKNLGNGFFADITFQAGLGVPSLQYLAWGTLFIDYDNDGDRDLFVANGHLDDNIHLFDAVTYAQQNQVFRNDGAARYTDVSDQLGTGLQLKQVSRGAAMGDYDNDGDLDVVVANNNQPAALLRNDGGNQGHWLSLHLVGRAVGAQVRVVAGDLTQVDVVRTGSSYLCQSAMRPFFGLGDRDRVDEVEIRWPSGALQRLQDIAANQLLTVREADAVPR